MSDNIAILDGYTVEYRADCSEYDTDLLVKPGTDTDDRFKAWDMHIQEYIVINGWLWNLEPVHAK